MTVISVESLSKSYRLGAIGGGTLRADVSRWLAKLRGKEDPNSKIGEPNRKKAEILKTEKLKSENNVSMSACQHVSISKDVSVSAFKKDVSVSDFSPDLFWALRDVSFEVKQGEILGIIGRNGAGKSTLLKILSRVTAPTSGLVKIKGRIASLLEVGTGFHPELTGRENVFLNGAILGMTKAEIKRKFDEIVDFSGVEQFLDTPVKRYSSGMYVRLAFAVAAHLEPEILIVDEVLAVGDAEFQKKCLGKMQEVSRGGRTVLFVSHQMEAVDRLTSRCIWLQNGSVLRAGTTGAIISDYLNASRSHDGLLSSHRVQSIANSVEIQTAKTLNNLGQPQTVFRQGENISIVVEVNASDKKTFDVAVVVENDREQALFASHYTDKGDAIDAIGKTTLSVTITPAVLRRGKYRVSLAVYTPDKLEFYDVIHHFPLFEIAGTVDKLFPDDIRWGDLYFQLPWKKH